MCGSGEVASGRGDRIGEWDERLRAFARIAEVASAAGRKEYLPRIAELAMQKSTAPDEFVELLNVLVRTAQWEQALQVAEDVLRSDLAGPEGDFSELRRRQEERYRRGREGAGKTAQPDPRSRADEAPTTVCSPRLSAGPNCHPRTKPPQFSAPLHTHPTTT